MLRQLRRTSSLIVTALVLSTLIAMRHADAGERHRHKSPRRVIILQPILPVCPGSPNCGAVPQTGNAAPAPAVTVPPAPPIPKAPEIVLLGYSVLGVPITMHVFGTEGKPVLIFGAIHGSEPNSGHLARHLLDHLLESPAAYSGRRVAIIAVANPDGLVRKRRHNENGIDLNRNFPATNWKESKRGSVFGGDKPASEPETLAIIKAVEMLQPDRIVSIHAITRGRECNNYDGPGAELAEAMKAKNGYRVAKTIGYPTPGSFGSWAGIDRQIATITLELPVDLPGDGCWAKHRDALLAVIQFNLRP